MFSIATAQSAFPTHKTASIDIQLRFSVRSNLNMFYQMRCHQRRGSRAAECVAATNWAVCQNFHLPRLETP